MEPKIESNFHSIQLVIKYEWKRFIFFERQTAPNLRNRKHLTLSLVKHMAKVIVATLGKPKYLRESQSVLPCFNSWPVPLHDKTCFDFRCFVIIVLSSHHTQAFRLTWNLNFFQQFMYLEYLNLFQNSESSFLSAPLTIIWVLYHLMKIQIMAEVDDSWL